MLKNIETDETISFFVTFLLLVAFQLEGARAPYLPLAASMFRGTGPEYLHQGVVKLQKQLQVKLRIGFIVC